MRPIRLTVQAFGPFAQRVVVDFRAALAQRLFGIYGPTGAGKTSVLDAMSYALFGVSSGGERTRAHLRSDLADLDTKTFVEFIFELGAKRYVVRREPEQDLKSPRRESRVYAQTAALFDVSLLTIEDISESNSGVAIAERRVREVDEALTHLLGYNAEQFRQVVMLPQGRFRDLLTASSDQRSEILRGLFDVSLYERAAERLRAQAADLETIVLAARRDVASRLQDLGVDDLAALAQRAEERQAKVAAHRLHRLELDADRLLAETALVAGRATSALFAETATAAASLAEQQALEPVRLLDRQRLTRAQAARELEPLSNSVQDALRSAEQLTQAVTAFEGQLALLQSAETAARAALDASEAREGERAALVLSQQRAERIVERVTAAAPLQARRLAAQGRLSAAMVAHASAETLRQERRADEALARSALDAARLGADRASVARLSLAQGRQSLAAATAYESQTTRVAAQGPVTAKAQIDLASAQAEADAKARHLGMAREARDAAQAAHLALALVDGEPCSVCGALDHPAPAGGGDIDQDLGADLRAAERADNQARDLLGQAERAAGEARVLTEELVRVLNTLTSPSASVAQLTEEITGLETALRSLEAGPTAAEASETLELAVQALTSAQVELEHQHNILIEARSAFDAVDAALVTELATVPDDLRDAEKASANLSGAAQALARALAAHRELEQALGQSVQASAVLQATLSERRGEAGRAEISAGRARESLAQALSARNLDAATFELARAEISQINELQGLVSAHQDALAAAHARAQRAAEAVAGKVPADLAALILARDQVDEALGMLIKTLADEDANVRELLAGQQRIIDALERQKAAEDSHRHVGELSRLAQGRNPLRMSLIDYAIAAYFEDVLRAANIRFDRMSAGRFELRRKTAAQDQRSRAGLDIAVFDAHSGRERDAQTLSGGEGFLAALALALGLSDVVQAEAGGVKLDAIFIDEGFGHLDEQSLERALDALRDMVGGARAVGVISHVEAVKTQIPAGFDVTPGVRGSHISARL